MIKKYSVEAGFENGFITQVTKDICPNHKDVLKLQMFNGNCLNVMADLPASSVDFVLADLPYEATQQNWDIVIPFDQLWAAYDRLCRPGAAIVLTATNPFAAQLITSKPNWFRYDLVWVKNKKTGFMNANRMPLRQHEHVLIFNKPGKRIYNAQKSAGHPPVHAVSARQNAVSAAVYGAMRKRTASGGSKERYPTSVLNFPVVNNDDPARIHRNQKPVELLAYLVKTYSNDGDNVLDNTMGSGSTAIACLYTGRNFVGIEQDAAFFSGALKRIQLAAKTDYKKPLITIGKA